MHDQPKAPRGWPAYDPATVWTLPWRRFPSGVEQAYLRWKVLSGFNRFIVSTALAIGVFDLFLPVDLALLPDVRQWALTLRLGALTPLGALILMLAGLNKARVIKRWPTSATDMLNMVFIVMAALSMAVLVARSNSPFAIYYHAGFAMVIMFANVVQRMRFKYTVWATACIYGIHLMALLRIHDVNERLALTVSLLVLTSASFTLRAAYFLEADERAWYLLYRRNKGLLAELKRAGGLLDRLTKQDPLTGLYNRRYLMQYTEQVWQRAVHDEGAIAVLMIDVGHFKAYNDRYGHPAGDACLEAVGKAMAACICEPEGMLARYGGEEFTVVLPGASPARAKEVAEALRASVERQGIEHLGSLTAKVATISIGVACLSARAHQTAHHLVSAADEALYRAKQTGRNRVSD